MCIRFMHVVSWKLHDHHPPGPFDTVSRFLMLRTIVRSDTGMVGDVIDGDSQELRMEKSGNT